jgi:hypothetical protein
MATAVGAFLAAIVVILIWQSVSWLKNAAEPNMAQYEPLTMSLGEEEDVNRVINGINEAKQNGTVYDEYITPRVFNGALQKIIAGEQRKGKAKPDALLAARGAFVNDHLYLRVTVPKTDEAGGQPQPQNAPAAILPQGRYINAEATFDLEIVEGEIIRAKVHTLVLRGREAPWLSRMVFNRFFIGGLKENSHKLKNDPANPFWAIKMLRREGDRLHVMLDGARMREQETKKGDSQEPQINANRR